LKKKKIFGYALISLSAILFIGILGQLGTVLRNILGLNKLISGELNAQQSGELIGGLLFSVFMVVFGIFLWKKGRKFIRADQI